MSKIIDLIQEEIKNSPEFKQYYNQSERDIIAQEIFYKLNPHLMLDLSDFNDRLELDELRNLFNSEIIIGQERLVNMARLNKEEYEILKGLDDKWKWISRDKNSDIFTFEEKPYKDVVEWLVDSIWAGGHDYVDYVEEVNLFQFIHWKDEEPYRISDLVKEYEKNQAYEILNRQFERLFGESEETEMKKNKEWAQKEVDGYLSYEGVSEARNALVFAKGVIDQLDEPEVLSQKWIEDNRLMKLGQEGIVYYVAVDDLQNLLVPKQELPVIPKFVADLIEEMKQDKRPLYSAMSSLMNKTNHTWSVWKSANKNFSEIMAQAWLNGYTVEEEQKYYALVKGYELIKDDHFWTAKNWKLDTINGNVFVSNRDTVRDRYLIKMSKEDWNRLGINDSNAHFVKVEELEDER